MACIRNKLAHGLIVSAVLCLLFFASCAEEDDSFVGQGGLFDSPLSVTISGNYAYVMSGNFDLSRDGKGAITVIDIKQSLIKRIGCVVGRVETPAYIGRFILSPDKTIGYLANRAANNILLYDMSDPEQPELMDLDPDHTGHQGIDVGIEPFGLDISPDGKILYVANVSSGDLSIVDLERNRLIKNQQLAYGITEVKLQPGGRYAYVTCKMNSVVFVIDTVTQEYVSAFAAGNTRTGIGTDSRAIAFTPDGSWAFIAARFPDSLLVIDTSKIPGHMDRAVVNMLPTDNKPTAVKVRPDGKEIWYTNYDANSVIALDAETGAVLSDITVGKGPYDLGFTEEDPDDPGQYYVYVPNFYTHSVSLIDAKTKEYVWVLP